MLRKMKLDSCQKIRQLLGMVIIASFFSVSCIQHSTNPIQNQGTLNKSISLLAIENECLNNDGNFSPLFMEVQNFINDIKIKRTSYSGNIFESWTYDFQNPMIVSDGILRSMMKRIENENKLDILSYKSLSQLDEYARRYEGKKCQFKDLASRQKSDIRPYFNLIQKNDTSDVNLQNLCQSTDAPTSCAVQIMVAKRQNKVQFLIDHYRSNFESKIYNPMFKMRSKHNNFTCQKNEDSTIEMNINVMNTGYDENTFESLLGSIQTTWSKNGLKINFTRVYSDNGGVLKIVQIVGGISYVSDDQPMTIHLSNDLDMMTIRRVVAHEFGHILGFPDCYIEFFNPKESQLIYYEISDKNFNLMCSVKVGALVEDDYIDQIKQNSCKF